MIRSSFFIRQVTIILISLLLLQSCGQPNTAATAEPVDSTESVRNESLPDTRDSVKTASVAGYREKINNDLNDWYFSVALYETSNRHTYKIHLQYEEVTGTDEITFPNLHQEPKPEIRKGEEPLSCMIGFIDQEGQFREYKKVAVKNGLLKITTVKSYAVYAK